MDAPARASDAPRPGAWRYPAALAVGLTFWIGLVAAMAAVVYQQTNWLRDADEANLREWLNEARVHRKSLPELTAEYVRLRNLHGLGEHDEPVVRKREEIA